MAAPLYSSMKCQSFNNEISHYSLFTMDKRQAASLCEANITNAVDITAALYDLRMGPSRRGETCATCSKQLTVCPLHYVYFDIPPIPFPDPGTHQGSRNRAASQMMMLGCIRCSAPRNLGKKGHYCWNCSSALPFSISFPKANIFKTVKVSALYKAKFKTTKDSVSTEYISNEDASRFFQVLEDKKEWRDEYPFRGNSPMSYMYDTVIVLPTAMRPMSIDYSGKPQHDDLTITYSKLLSAVQEASGKLQAKSVATKRAKSPADSVNWNQRIFLLAQELWNNGALRSKGGNSSEPVGSLKSCLESKGGHIRGRMTGKRYVSNGMTPINGDAEQEYYTVGVPIKWASVLVIPEKVCRVNIDRLSRALEQGGIGKIKRPGMREINVLESSQYIKINESTKLLVGDTVIRPSDDPDDDFAEPVIIKVTPVNVFTLLLNVGDRIERTDRSTGEVESYDYRGPVTYALIIGDTVEAFIQNGDYCMFGRWPMISKYSQCCFPITLHPERILKISYASTGAYNADFDGDQMTCIPPSTVAAQTEMRLNASAEAMFISNQNSMPISQVIQDTAAGLYFMTNYDDEIPEETFRRLASRIEGAGIVSERTGKSLFSMMLPLSYNLDTNVENEYTDVKSRIVVHNGAFLAGYVHKGVVNSKMIPQIHTENGFKTVSRFISECQWTALKFLEWFGFTICLRDCFSRNAHVFHRNYRNAFEKAIKFNHLTSNIRTIKMMAELDRANAANSLLVSQEFSKMNNGIMYSILSKDKGNKGNHYIISRSVGQLTHRGRLLVPSLYGGRSLVCYPIDRFKNALAWIFEQTGLIRNSYAQGLSAMMHYLAAIPGRHTLINRKMATGVSGYHDARAIKRCEDAVTQHDGSVRHISSMKVYSLQQNDYDYDVTKCVHIRPKFVYGEWLIHIFCVDLRREIVTLCNEFDLWTIERENSVKPIEAKRILSQEEIEYVSSVIPLNKSKIHSVAVTIRSNIRRTVYSELKGQSMYPFLIDALRDKLYLRHINATYRVHSSNGLNGAVAFYAPISQNGMNEHSSVGGTIIEKTDTEKANDILSFNSTSTKTTELYNKHQCRVIVKLPQRNIKAVRDWISNRISYLEFSTLVRRRKLIRHNGTSGELHIIWKHEMIYAYRVTMGLIRERIYEAFAEADPSITIDNASMAHRSMVIRSDNIDNLNNKIMGLYVSGMIGVRKYEIYPVHDLSPDSSVKTGILNDYEILTQGSNTRAMMYQFGPSVSTNDPREIMDIYGIEGHVRWSKRQLAGIGAKSLLKSDVHYQHSDIIIDVMSRYGDFRPSTRFGLSSDTDSSAGKLLSFETPVNNIALAAMQSKSYDAKSDISGAIIMAASPALGCAAVDLRKEIEVI